MKKKWEGEGGEGESGGIERLENQTTLRKEKKNVGTAPNKTKAAERAYKVLVFQRVPRSHLFLSPDIRWTWRNLFVCTTP